MSFVLRRGVSMPCPCSELNQISTRRGSKSEVHAMPHPQNTHTRKQTHTRTYARIAKSRNGDREQGTRTWNMTGDSVRRRILHNRRSPCKSGCKFPVCVCLCASGCVGVVVLLCVGTSGFGLAQMNM